MIDGFEALLGPELLHIPMFIALLVLGYPKHSCLAPEAIALAIKLWWVAVIFHFFASWHLLGKRHSFIWAHPMAQNLAPVMIVLQCYLSLCSMQIVF